MGVQSRRTMLEEPQLNGRIASVINRLTNSAGWQAREELRGALRGPKTKPDVLINIRFQLAMGSPSHHGYVTARTYIPRRTDIDAPIPYRRNKHVLFGQQEGLCAECKGGFLFKLFEVDHRVPRSRGGTDHLDNLQLLCSSCNRIKGDRPREYLAARLAEIGGSGLHESSNGF